MRCGLFVFALCLLVSSARAAGPYVPASRDEVLERLPTKLFAKPGELALLRRQLAAEPNDVEMACIVARRYLQLGGESGDPRFYGYAHAALARWWDQAEPPPAVLQLRAKLHEKNHDYQQALADLTRLLKATPEDPQAWIEVANLNRVQGNYAASQAAVDELAKFAEPFAVLMARAPLLVVTGQAEEAGCQLAEALPFAVNNYPNTVPWIHTLEADVATALGQTDRAEELLREGLVADPTSYYLLRSYAELLLDAGRDAEVLKLAADNLNDDGVLLCAAIAARRTGAKPQAAEYRALLEGRFDAIRARGDLPLGRFESRCALELQDDPQRALKLALANWRQQKEVHDTIAVLEAAVAAKDIAAAEPVLAFIAEHRTQHPKFAELRKQLEAM